MSKRVRILLGGILLALMSANFGANVYSTFLPPKGSDDGLRGDMNSKGEFHITVVTPNGPATALQVGDEVIAINGVKIKEDPKILNTVDTSRLPPGTGFTMTIRRAGELRDVVILTVPRQVQFNPVVLIIATFLLAAWIVFLLRPDDKQAWLLALMLGTLTGLMGRSPSDLPSWLSLIAGAARALGLLFPPAG